MNARTSAERFLRRWFMKEFASNCSTSRPPSPQPQLQVFKVGGFPGAFANVQVTLTPPRKQIICLGNDAGGSTDLFLTFGPSIQQGPTGILLNVLQVGAIPFLPISSNNGLPIGVRFRVPMNQVFISSFDTGQPGSFDWFIATDDYVSDTVTSSSLDSF